jgi:hypothetical protein
MAEIQLRYYNKFQYESNNEILFRNGYGEF